MNRIKKGFCITLVLTLFVLITLGLAACVVDSQCCECEPAQAPAPETPTFVPIESFSIINNNPIIPPIQTSVNLSVRILPANATRGAVLWFIADSVTGEGVRMNRNVVVNHNGVVTRPGNLGGSSLIITVGAYVDGILALTEIIFQLSI